MHVLRYKNDYINIDIQYCVIEILMTHSVQEPQMNFVRYKKN